MISFAITSLLVTLLAFTALWLIHVPLRDAGIIDYYWGPGFAVIGWSAFAAGASVSGGKVLFMTAVTIWAVRLAGQLIARHRFMEGEDARYAAMRDAAGEAWWWKNLFKVFLLQAVILWAVATPVHAVVATSADASFSAIGWLAFAVFLAGLAIETVADWQLFRHRIERRSGRQTFAGGLFRYARHPNYFGEILVWGALGIAAFDLSGQWYALIGPVMLTLIIRFISVPITEAHLSASRPDYDAYRDRTPAILPSLAATSRPGSRERPASPAE